MIIHDFEQRSSEWFAARLGKMTASRFKDVMAKGQGKSRHSYMLQIAAERLSNLPQESYTNAAMEWGTEHEADAIKAYEDEMQCVVNPVGFIEHSAWVGASPDGLVGEGGNVEVKCPNSTTHLNYILTNKVDPKYKGQVQGQLWVSGRQWCDWISYDPRIPQHPLHVIRIDRDEEYIAKLEVECERFKQDCVKLMSTITGMP